jgi:nucleoside-diphosphate-sugar epimerase
MRVLVTGGAGFIGSHLTRALLEAGHSVRVVDNFETGHRRNLSGCEDAELVRSDIRCRSELALPMAGIEAVFHLAAIPSVPRSWSDPVGALACNALGTANVIEAAMQAGAGCFIYSSSSSVYGNQPGDRKSERLEPMPISPYGYSKLLGEKVAHAYARAGGIRVVSLRYFNVFGPRQDPDSPYAAVIPRFIRAAIEDRPVAIHGDGLQSRDFTYVGNVLHANLLALNSDARNVIVNVACGEAITLLALVRAISDLVGRPLMVEHDSARPGDVKHSLADCSLAQTVLSYRPQVDFQTGLRQTYEWFNP